MFGIIDILKVQYWKVLERLTEIEDSKWYASICKSYSNPPVIVNGKPLPGFPPDDFQIKTTGSAGTTTLREAFNFYRDCRNTFKAMGVPIQPRCRLLDFGVGWGRIARFFLHDLPLENIYGVDVMENFIKVCRQTFGTDNFQVIDPYPPLNFPDNTFDFVVGYSVFSHLSEQACASWMKEFHRILVPGGIVAVTTRARSFFDHCQSLKDNARNKHPSELSEYAKALANLFDDFEAAKARYDNGEFVHSNREGVTGSGAMTAEFYGESFIPEAYARTAYADYFELEKFLFDERRQTQPILFFRRKNKVAS
ncbi:class I SAM-dependent methyltransferase [Candidatus Methylocalor cossyra]